MKYHKSSGRMFTNISLGNYFTIQRKIQNESEKIFRKQMTSFKTNESDEKLFTKLSKNKDNNFGRIYDIQIEF